MSRRSVRPLEPSKLNGLSTQRLLAYRDRLLSLEDSAAASDWSETEVEQIDRALLHFKDDPRWEPLYRAVLTVLSTRPHVP